MTEHSKSDTPLMEERTTGFLLGLILVLSLLYVAFQYNSQPQDAQWPDDALDELVQDIELAPATTDKDLVTATPQQPAQTVSERIKAIDEPLRQQIERLSVKTANPLLTGDGEAVAMDTKVSAALPPVAAAGETPVSFRVVQQMPEFPGGGSAFVQWLTRQLKYPPAAQSQKIQGRVVVSFIVNKDGSIADVRLQKSVNPYLDREALRVIRMMPRWTPGVQNDKPCRTMVAVPVVFKL